MEIDFDHRAQRSESLYSQSTTMACPDDNFYCVPLYLTHFPNLTATFFRGSLINAYGVDPKYTRLRPRSEVTQGFSKGPCDSKAFTEHSALPFQWMLDGKAISVMCDDINVDWAVDGALSVGKCFLIQVWLFRGQKSSLSRYRDVVLNWARQPGHQPYCAGLGI